jgi:acid stress-induced BolA-like protein IbaG/YrbA
MEEEVRKPLIEVVKEALIAAGYGPAEIDLETTSTGKVGGFVVSGSFAGVSQMERQERLWSQLSKHLDSKQLSCIVSLLTMTPEETEDDVRSASG